MATTQQQATEAARRVLDACGQTRTRPPYRARRDRGASEWNVLWDDYWVRVWDDTGRVWVVSPFGKTWNRRPLSPSSRPRIQTKTEARAWAWRLARVLGAPGDARLTRLNCFTLPTPPRAPLVSVLFEQTAPGGYPYLDSGPHLDLQFDARDGAIARATQDWGRYVLVPSSATAARVTRDQARARAEALYRRFLARRAALENRPPRPLPAVRAIRQGYSAANGNMVRNGELEADLRRAGRPFPPIYPVPSRTPFVPPLRLAWAVTFEDRYHIVLNAFDNRLLGFSPYIAT